MRVTAADAVLADGDGVLFLPLDRITEIAGVAAGIRDTERRQAERMRQGTTLREQTRFDRYLARRDETGVTFRQHLRQVGGEVEE